MKRQTITFIELFIILSTCVYGLIWIRQIIGPMHILGWLVAACLSFIIGSLRILHTIVEYVFSINWLYF